jgi:hypothetical protein
MASPGLPIVGDSLYPHGFEVAPDDLSRSLVCSHTLEKDDPVTGVCRMFESARSLLLGFRTTGS